MKFEDIQSLWEEDCNIDRMNLGDEALKIPKLHSKYYKIYVQEAVRLRQLEAEYKVLRLEKYEFLTMGPTIETKDRGWKQPAQSRVLKTEAEMYMEADPDLIALSLKIGVQKEKTKFLEAVIKEITSRNWSIRVALDYEKFRSGA